MHELAVTQNILEIVTRHAEQAQAQRVLRVNLVIGALSGIVDDSVQFCFDFLTANTIAAGAMLSFARRPVRVVCGACQHAWSPPDADWTCPACGAAQARVVEGREFYIDSIEVE
jgi:hydrogenase nickel incorporation protein HypA/HybF